MTGPERALSIAPHANAHVGPVTNHVLEVAGTADKGVEYNRHRPTETDVLTHGAP